MLIVHSEGIKGSLASVTVGASILMKLTFMQEKGLLEKATWPFDVFAFASL